MQANIALGFLETSSIAKGIEASDAMCKMASVRLSRAGVIPRGKYTIQVSGPVGEVESALRAGAEIAGDAVVHKVIIRNVHQQVMDAMDKRLAVEVLEAVGVIETREAIAAIHAADAAAKAAKVRLIEVKTMVGGGKGYVTMTGEVGAVRAAVAAAVRDIPEAGLVSQVVIAQADAQLLDAVGK
jgi:microcompartment protein CcmL/EutN